jgi:transposase
VIQGFREEADVNRDGFWLTEEQFARIAPHLPTDTRGKARVDDRRVISGIVHVLKSGGRWIDVIHPR